MYIDFLMLKLLFLKKINNKEYELFHLNFDVFLNFIFFLFFFLPFINFSFKFQFFFFWITLFCLFLDFFLGIDLTSKI